MTAPRALGLLCAALALCASPVVFTQPQSPQSEQPRFRAGANLVRLDAYVSKDGTAIEDLTAADFEVLEDGVPQKIESFELIRPRRPGPESARVEPSTVAGSREMAADPDSRVFVLFLDLFFVQLDGSYHANQPIAELLDRAIGQDDLVAVMTSDMSARNMTFSRRTKPVAEMLREYWHWGQRGRISLLDPREREISDCYPPTADSARRLIAERVIMRRRLKTTLDALEDLIGHLESIREERKFVFMFTEGWRWPRRDDELSAPVDGQVPGIGVIGVGPEGKLTKGDARNPQGNLESCDRERMRLASIDFEQDFTHLLQRANRANVSFYPVDARGLVALDNPMAMMSTDAPQLAERRSNLRTLAEVTGGTAILDTNNVTAAMARVVEDIGSYYLLGYYSTNTRMDGRFRKISVKVKRPGAAVRARPGYLAPNADEAAAPRATSTSDAGGRGLPEGVRTALDRLAPARGTVPVRTHAAAVGGRIAFIAELDPTTIKLPEWEQGGRAHILLQHDRGAAPPIEVDLAIAVGQRTLTVQRPDGAALPPGRYVIRLSLQPAGSTIPIETTTDVEIPAADARIAATVLASRRGPATGLRYDPTADARYRRTERIRLELPRLGATGAASARLLGRDGQVLPIVVTITDRPASKNQPAAIVADLTLAPLAQGEYIIEISVDDNGTARTVSYAFRIVP